MTLMDTPNSYCLSKTYMKYLAIIDSSFLKTVNENTHFKMTKIHLKHNMLTCNNELTSTYMFPSTSHKSLAKPLRQRKSQFS